LCKQARRGSQHGERDVKDRAFHGSSKKAVHQGRLPVVFLFREEKLDLASRSMRPR
jgi:hypothetical protein